MVTLATSPKCSTARAVLFDLDGTLVHTHIDFAAMRVGVLVAAEAAGVERERIAGLDVLAMGEAAAAIVRARAGDEAAREFRNQVEEAMVAQEMRGIEGARPAPFVAEVLGALVNGGVRVGIVTRNCRRATDAVLPLVGVPCPVVLTREDVTRRKPDPAHLLAALERLAVDPEAAVMVGDHAMDIEAGHRAGTRTVGILGPGRTPEHFHDVAPDRIIPDLRDLLPFVFGMP